MAEEMTPVTHEDIEAFAAKLAEWVAQLPQKDQVIARELVKSALGDEVEGFTEVGGCSSTTRPNYDAASFRVFPAYHQPVARFVDWWERSGTPLV
jgi:hypothetical protein